VTDHKTSPKENQLKTAQEFLDFVFHAQLDDEEICLWSTSRQVPGFPTKEEGWGKAYLRAGRPQACYMGCSTMAVDPKGNLYNRQSQFTGFHVLVLDDVGSGPGSKLAKEALPEAYRKNPSYIIETSPDNFQYGYSLDEPIRDLELAKAFQRLLIQKLGVDRGGCMPNKLVRLPCGVNLKEKYQDAEGNPFECRFEQMLGHHWSPELLMRQAEIETTWDALVAGARPKSRRAGTSEYRTHIPYQMNLDGIIDPVLEWLQREDQIITETGEWITILCPWASAHTTGENSAGYTPLGMGSRPTTRGFHCFHDGCNDKNTRDFLLWVVEEDGPKAGQNGQIEQFVSRYAFDMENNQVIDMKSPDFKAFPFTGFKNQLAGLVWIPAADGTFKGVNECTAWGRDPDRMRFAGRLHEVGGPEVIHNFGGGYPSLNSWNLPKWGVGHFDRGRVAPFLEFIRYLIPDPEDAEWFLDHLASKAQNPKYRGPGVIMTTPIEGSGRGTLQTILARLWSWHNVTSVSLSNFLEGCTSANYNGWILADWVFIPEAKETNMSARMEFTAYESSKNFVDTAPSPLELKIKYLVNRLVLCYGSTILCSQHLDVLPMDTANTRFRRLRNTTHIWSPKKFEELYGWIESGMEADVWRWLLARDLGNMAPFARQEVQDTRDNAVWALGSGRGVDGAIGLCLAFAREQTHGVVFINEFLGCLEKLALPLGLDTIRNWERPVKRELRNRAEEIRGHDGTPWRHRFGDKQYRLRAISGPDGDAIQDAWSAERKTPAQKELCESISDMNLTGLRESFIQFVRDALADAE